MHWKTARGFLQSENLSNYQALKTPFSLLQILPAAALTASSSSGIGTASAAAPAASCTLAPANPPQPPAHNQKHGCGQRRYYNKICHTCLSFPGRIHLDKKILPSFFLRLILINSIVPRQPLCQEKTHSPAQSSV
jgi:hypothetical protein